jgi:hypothetical protein
MKNYLEHGWKVRIGFQGQLGVVSARDKADAQTIFRRNDAKGLAVSVYKDGALQWETERAKDESE